jgi:hypothetical protein
MDWGQERTEYEKEIDNLNQDRANGCACLFVNSVCMSQCSYHAKQVVDLQAKLEAWYTWYSFPKWRRDDSHATQVKDLETQIIDLRRQIHKIKKMYSALSGPRAHGLGCDCGEQVKSGYTCKQFSDLMKEE